MAKVAVVTGGTSGIGLATVERLLEKGVKVYSLSRNAPKSPSRATHISADVADEASVKAAVAEILKTEKTIDILVNNAGFGISGAVEFTEPEDAKRLFDVNFFGVVNMTRALIPIMRENGGGRIINISSVAGVIPIPFQTYYSAAKAAINAYTLATQNEVRDFGITLCAIMPGDIKTGFTAAREKQALGDDIYSGKITRSVTYMERDEQRGMPPEAVGRVVAACALKTRVKPLRSIGFKYRLFCVLIAVLPHSLSNRIVGMLYAK